MRAGIFPCTLTVLYSSAFELNLPQGERDAFFELVLYPAKASAQVAELYITVGRNRLYASQGRASTNDLAAQARTLFQADANLSNDTTVWHTANGTT